MGNQQSGGVSGGTKMAIGAVVILVLGGFLMFGGSGDKVTEDVTTDTPADSTSEVSTEPIATTPTNQITKGSDILASGKDTVCTSPVTASTANSVTFLVADGNARVDTVSATIENHVILKKDGTAYYWGSAYKGILTGPQYTTSARMLLQFPINGYTCTEKTISASVFVPPAN